MLLFDIPPTVEVDACNGGRGGQHGHRNQQTGDQPANLLEPLTSAQFDHAIKLPDARGALRQIFESIYAEFTGKHHFAQEIIACHLRTLVWLVRQHFAEPITESQTQVARCLNYIHENYAHDFPAEVLARKVFVSPSYLFRIFRKKKGVTPMHYRNLVRVDKAKLLLLDPKFKMEEVAERVGFKDVKYFARVFKKETGSAPSEFRKRNRPA